MINCLSVNKSKKSKITRLSFLPRLGLFIDVGNYEIIYRHAPIFESLVNLYQKGFSHENFKKIVRVFENVFAVILPWSRYFECFEFFIPF